MAFTRYNVPPTCSPIRSQASLSIFQGVFVIRAFQVAFMAFLIGALIPAPSHALALGASPDSLTRATWRLSNGLTVKAQHVPAAGAVSITMAYHGGSDGDPAGREGQALLRAELAYTAAAGSTPERSRQELRSLRPLGSEVKVTRTQTQLTEVASLTQFPGVLHQVAERARGVRVTPASLAAALASLRQQQRDAYLEAPSRALYYDVAALAAGMDSSALRLLGRAPGLDRVGVSEMQKQIATAFVPANGVLSIAGNLDGPDLRALVEREFGSIPAGQVLPATLHHRFVASSTTLRWPGLERPVGCVGVSAPSLRDTLHPVFYLTLLVVASKLGVTWGPPTPPLQSRFQYSILDDPELIRFYPRLEPTDRTPANLGQALAEDLNANAMLVADEESLESLRAGVGWLLGAPLLHEMVPRFQKTPGLLVLLSSSTASRELWGGEAVWAPYRRLMDRCNIDGASLIARASNPRNQVRLMLTP
jgi:hypothetical protein